MTKLLELRCKFLRFSVGYGGSYQWGQPMWQRYFSSALQNSFDKAKRQNAALSLRAYARQLDVSPSTLSEILRDQRKISGRRALEIASKASLDGSVWEELQKKIAAKPEPKSRQILPSQATDLVVNPLYYRLLCALEVLPTPADVSAVADFLEIDTKSLQKIVSKLELFGIVRLENSQIYWQGQRVTTSEDIPNKKIQGFHKSSLKAAAAGLDLPVDQREYTSVTFAGSTNRIPDAKNYIRQMRDAVSDSMQDPQPNQIYELSIQLRPVSKVLNIGDKK